MSNIKTENSRNRQEFFREIYEENFDLIYRFVFSRLSGNADDVEDMVQDIFFEVMRSFDSFHNKSSLSTWIIGIAKHKISDYYKKVSKTIACLLLDEETEVHDFADTEKEINSFDNSKLILIALNKINEIYRVFLAMKYIEGYSMKEICRISGKTIKSVDGILQRAKSEFKKQYLKLAK